MHIVPFFRIALAVSDQMIEKSALPNPAPAASDGGSYNPLKSSKPNTEVEVVDSGHEQMDVIRHNDITT